MVSPHLELPTLASAVNDLPTLMDDQTNLLDQALQGDVDFVVTAGGTIVISKTISLRNFMFNLTGTPSAAFNVDFPTNNRYFAVNNKSGETATIRIDGGGGTTVEVIDAEQRIIYIDGTDVIDVTGVGVPNLETLVIRGTDFAVTTTTLTAIDWNAETRDEGDWHDNSTDPEQIKVGVGIVDAVVKVHIINLDANDTLTVKLQRYNSSDALQETLAEDNREHDASVDMVINLCVLNIRTAAGDYLTVEVKSSADATYSIESDDSYFLVRRATTGGAGGGGGGIFSGARVRLASDQTIIALVDQAFIWGTEDYDTDDYFTLVEEVATDISFTAPDLIASAGSNFGSFSVGQIIRVQGTTSQTNDGTFKIEAITAAQITTVETTVTTQGAGATITVSSGSHLLIPSDGYYRLTAGFHAATFSSEDAFSFYIGKNVSGFPGSVTEYKTTLAASGTKGGSLSVEDFFNTGDFLEFRMFHTIGSTHDFQANEATFFSISKIGEP